MSGAAYIRITRPINSLFAGFAGILATIIATGVITPDIWYVFFIVSLITGAGNVINDYYDAKIDSINQPDRPIPSGEISKNAALCFAGLLFIAGNLIALIFAPPVLLIIAVFNSVLLWLYAAYFKTTPFIGNLVVSYLTSSIFIFGGAIQGISGVISVLPISGATLGVILARELVKDAEDLPGDMACGARTVPILYGIRITLLLSLICACAGIIISFFMYSRWGLPYLAAIAIPDIIILYGAVIGIRKRTSDEVIRSKSSKYLKIGMFLSLLVFLGSAVLI